VPDAEELRSRVASIPWYHTLELAPGVVTPGWFDTRAALGSLPFPDDLTGARCLDVGTYDGFWAFTMEARGAREVHAIDVLDPAGWDWPAGSEDAARDAIGGRKARGVGFEIAHEALGSSVVREERSVYDLSPAAVGEFDFVYVGSILLHLRDPVGALAAVRSVCRGRALVVDAVDPLLSSLLPRRAVAGLDAVGRPWWWKPNVAGLVRMVEAAGFRAVGAPRRLWLRPGAGQPLAPARPGLVRSAAGREALLTRWKGDPHAALLVEAR
jgi:tRNA (mo5U34)-methyltransferase